MLSPYRIPIKSNKRKLKTSSDLKTPQMTSNDAAVEPVKPVKPRNKMKSGGNIENIDEY